MNQDKPGLEDGKPRLRANPPITLSYCKMMPAEDGPDSVVNLRGREDLALFTMDELIVRYRQKGIEK